jgi:hypothetical protein
LVLLDLDYLCRRYKGNMKTENEKDPEQKKEQQPNWATPGAQQGHQPSSSPRSPLLSLFLFFLFPSLTTGPR